MLETQWVLIKEPKSMGLSILASIPLMIVNLLATLLVLSFFSSVSLVEFGINESSISFTVNIWHIIGVFLILLIHEIFHLIFIPNFIKSKHTYLGIKFWYGFVYSEEFIPRNRYIIISIAPFMIISIILPMLIGLAGLMTTYAKFLVLLNAVGSSVDILNLIIIIFQVPAKSMIISNGMRTYWKEL